MRPILAVAAVLAALLLAAGGAAAHKTTYTPDDKVKIVWGFLNEPAVTMTKTGLDLALTENATGAPIEGAEKTLTVSLVLGGETHEFEDLAAQFGTKGKYTDKITLTRPGLYSLRLVGTISGTQVDMTIPAQHEVEAIEETYFPAMAPADVASLQAEVADLEARLAALEAKAKTQSGTPATVTPQDNDVPAPGLVPSLAVLGVAALLLLRRRG